MATNKVQTGLRLNEPLYDKIRTISSLEKRSLNNMIEFVLQKYVEDYEKINGPVPLPDEE